MYLYMLVHVVPIVYAMLISRKPIGVNSRKKLKHNYYTWKVLHFRCSFYTFKNQMTTHTFYLNVEIFFNKTYLNFFKNCITNHHAWFNDNTIDYTNAYIWITDYYSYKILKSERFYSHSISIFLRILPSNYILRTGCVVFFSKYSNVL